jgi:predicted ATPase
MQAGDNIQLTIEKATQLSIKENLYIPSERNLIPLLREGQFEEGLKDANIPAGVIAFGEAYMRAAKFLQTYKTNIFDVTFQRKGTEDYIVLPNEKTLKLSEVASGMQTTIPALLVLEHLAKNGKPRSFTFEEPELNLFPTAQKALVEFLAEKVLNNGHQLVICTHSPYILTSFNNLLYAYELGVKKRKNNLPIPKNNWLDIEQVSGYLVENGTTENIFNSETYMLIAEKIDEAGEQIRDIFNELLDIDSED